MTIESRVEMAIAALLEAGRPDLADRLIPADEVRVKYPDMDEPPICWWKPSSFVFNADGPTPEYVEDEILFRRAAAIAVLSDGYDGRDLHCEACIRNTSDPGCTRVTRSEFLAHIPCTLHDVSHVVVR